MSITLGGSSPAVTFPDATVQNTAGLPLSGGTLSGPLIVPTLNAPSGVLATQNGMNGIAKAWVNFTGSTATINGSFNVSSVTRSSTGQYLVNFTTAMPNANYSVTQSYIPDANFSNSSAGPRLLFIASQSTTVLGISTGYQTGSGAGYIDFPTINASVFSS